MHKAKGLQFDHVVLYGLGRIPGGGSRKVLSWIDIPNEHGDEEYFLSPVGARTDLENDPLHKYIERTQMAKDRFEQGRLLYVACTRAKQSLHLIGHTELNKDATELRAPDARSLLNLLWPAVSAAYDKVFDPDAVAVPESDSRALLTPVLRRLESAWSLPQPLPLPGQQATVEDSAGAEKVEFYWVGTAARVAGTIVHRWLQLIADDSGYQPENVLQSIRPVTRRWLLEMGISGDSAAEICERVEIAIRQTLDDDKGQWILQGGGQSELHLSGVIEGEIESVVLDRIRIAEDGIHWIIDYKTSSHEGGDLDSFLQAEADRYLAQLQKYAAMYRAYSGAEVRCALYFPLLQHFAEITI
jgi:ATP-dependent helicase/nuclease subunit A